MGEAGVDVGVSRGSWGFGGKDFRGDWIPLCAFWTPRYVEELSSGAGMSLGFVVLLVVVIEDRIGRL